jgi:saccharopine dehydrogenase (NAD+, L-lysine-forming)
MPSKTVLHLRSETKPLEHRSCLTPTTTKALIDSGRFDVVVEKSPNDPSRKRIFDDAEFEAVGATLVEDQSWTTAPKDHIIVGLKELEAEAFPLVHTHGRH